VHPGQLDLPERRADRLGIGLAGLGDRGRDGADAVIAAEALGQTCERITALLPFVDEGLRHGRIGRDIGVPRREEGAVGGVLCRPAPACHIHYPGFCEPPVVRMRFFKPSPAACLKISVSCSTAVVTMSVSASEALILASCALMSCAGGSMVSTRPTLILCSLN